MLKYITLIVCLFVFTQTQAFRGHFKHHLPPPPIEKYLAAPPEQHFNQILDHFKPTDTRTWPQRFWENFEHYKNGGPAFIMIGGEGE